MKFKTISQLKIKVNVTNQTMVITYKALYMNNKTSSRKVRRENRKVLAVSA